MELLSILGLSAIFSNPCSWDKPGFNPYTGSVENAIHNYKDIPPGIQTRLIAKIKNDNFDDTVSIKRESIEGKFSYSPEIKGMHFGKNRTCSSVTRRGWSETHSEPSKVYCEGSYCIAVPSVCNNISRVTRYYSSTAGDNPGAGGGGGGYGPSNYPTNWYKPTEYSWVNSQPVPVVPLAPVPQPNYPVPIFIPPYEPGPGWIKPITPIPAVPETPLWQQLLAGLALILYVWAIVTKDTK
jgi:hypothetical protein